MIKIEINGCVLELVKGDITEQEVEAIVNAANEKLSPGGGVDGAIHRKGGPAILEEIQRKYAGCPTGSAVVTGAGNLKAKYVIHAVGPIFRDGKSGEAELLASAYRSALERAIELEINSIAFPSLSTGAYGYPIREAAKVALETVMAFLQERGKPALVRFVLYQEDHYQVFKEVLNNLRGLSSL